MNPQIIAFKTNAVRDWLDHLVLKSLLRSGVLQFRAERDMYEFCAIITVTFMGNDICQIKWDARELYEKSMPSTSSARYAKKDTP